MKVHPGWLAAVVLLSVVLACNMSKNSNNANNSNSNSNSNRNANTSRSDRPADADVYVETLKMAKDDNGKPGESTTTFEASDHIIHCVAELNKAKKGTDVTFIWKIVDAGGSRNKEIRKTDYTTKSFESSVRGHLSLTTDWPKGKWEVEVYINGVLDKTIPYTIE